MLSNAVWFVSIPAVDPKRAKHFFAEKLGLQPTVEQSFSILYQQGDRRFQIVQSASAGNAEHSLLTWEVTDIGIMVAGLLERGVTFVEYDLPYLKTDNYIAKLEGVRLAWFRDSEQNLHALVER